MDEFPRSSTPEPSPKRQRTSRKTSTTNTNIPRESRSRAIQSAGTVETAEPTRVIGSSERLSDPLAQRSEGTVEPAEPTRVIDSSERSSDPLGHQAATPGWDPEEAAIEDTPTRVLDSAERSSQPEDSPMMAASWILPEVPTSTGVDTGAMPTTELEQAAWDASVMPISTGTDTDRNSMTVVAVPGDNSDGSTSTGVGADGTTSTRPDSDGGATSEQESSSSRLISVEDSFVIAGGGPRTVTAPTRVNDSSERSSEPIDGTVRAWSGELILDKQGRLRTPVVWGQGIPLRPPRTIARIFPKRVDQAVQTTSQVQGVQPSIMSNILPGILPGHASVTEAITRLQSERDLALRRVEELHVHYKRELKSQQDDDRRMTKWNKEQHERQLSQAREETAQYKMQVKNAKSLIETQKLSIKLLQDELGEEAEFDAEETAQMRSVRRE